MNTKTVYDVRARYAADQTWVVRCRSLPGLLWFLLRALTGRLRRHPEWPDEVLRFEIVRSTAAFVPGFDHLRQAFQLHVGEGAADRDLVIEDDRRVQVLEILRSLRSANETGLSLEELEFRLRHHLLDPPPYLPPGERSVFTTRGVAITTEGLWRE